MIPLVLPGGGLLVLVGTPPDIDNAPLVPLAFASGGLLVLAGTPPSIDVAPPPPPKPVLTSSKIGRERDIRGAVMDALRSTGEFDTVNTGRDKGQEVEGDGSAFAHVDPHDARQEARWDTGGSDGTDVMGRCRVTLSVSDNDPQTRDDRLERLLDVLQNLVNNENLAEMTLPAFSGIHSWRWLPAKAPIRQVEALFEYRYLLDTSQDFGTED